LREWRILIAIDLRQPGPLWSAKLAQSYAAADSLQESWQNLTLSKLRFKLFLIPGELTRPQNRPILRLRQSSMLQELADDMLRKIGRLKPIVS